MKPRIIYWKHGLWECVGNGLHSFDSTIAGSYARWLEFNKRMRVDH